MNPDLFFLAPMINFMVKGYKRSAIYDFPRYQMTFFPNDVIDFCRTNNKKQISKILSFYSKNDRETIIDYIEALVEKEYAFLGSEQDEHCYLEIKNNWEDYSHISNIIILYDPKTNLDIFISELDELNVSALQIILLEPIPNIEYLLPIIKKIERLTYLEDYEIVLNDIIHAPSVTEFSNFVRLHTFRLSLLLIGSQQATNWYEDRHKCTLVQTSQKINPCNSCGFVRFDNLVLNQVHFFESMLNNTCVNRKVCIDEHGNIKNCLALNKIYGNIYEDKLSHIASKKNFRELWKISKDKIDVCKDCEFRHACTDCRGFIKDPQNIYSQPSKCTYNPYIAKWADEDGYVPVEDCGTYSKETGFVPDKKKIAALNKQIWGDDE
jgi:SPASM domain peptide maturase of grasp-with-spasm system